MSSIQGPSASGMNSVLNVSTGANPFGRGFGSSHPVSPFGTAQDSGLRLNFAVTDARALGDALRQSGAQLYESVGDRGRALVGRNHSADPRASASTSTQALCALLAELPVSRTQVRDAPSRT